MKTRDKFAQARSAALCLGTMALCGCSGDGQGSAETRVATAQQPLLRGALGDANGDGASDITFTGFGEWHDIPQVISNRDGTFHVLGSGVTNFPQWAALSGAKALSGDFNGDGRSDVLLTGVPGWNTVPIALSNGSPNEGSYTVTNTPLTNFPAWAATANVKAVPGDFDGNKHADVALVGGGFTTIPIAFAGGAGANITLTVTNAPTNPDLQNFLGWATAQNVTPVPGDFNADGREDIALTGASWFTSVPIAFSNGDGTFAISNKPLADFPQWAGTYAGAVPISGDFNGDGRTDIILIGSPGFGSLPVALSNGDGTFTVVNAPLAKFPGWAGIANVKAVAGDYDGDGFCDIALVSGGFTSVPIAFSNGNGTFNVSNKPMANIIWFGAPHSTPMTGFKSQ